MADEVEEKPEDKNPLSTDLDLEVNQEPISHEESKGKLATFIVNMSFRERLIGLVAGFGVLALVCNFLVIKPLDKHIVVLDQTIQDHKTAIPEKLVVLQRKNKILIEMQENRSYLTDPELSLEEETAALLREIERVSQDVGLFISNITPAAAVESEDEIKKLKIDIEGVGIMRSIKNFLIDLERSNPPVIIKAVNLRTQGNDTEELRYHFTVLKLSAKG